MQMHESRTENVDQASEASVRRVRFEERGAHIAMTRLATWNTIWVELADHMGLIRLTVNHSLSF